jgi:hypothetical protein
LLARRRRGGGREGKGGEKGRKKGREGGREREGKGGA